MSYIKITDESKSYFGMKVGQDKYRKYISLNNFSDIVEKLPEATITNIENPIGLIGDPFDKKQTSPQPGLISILTNKNKPGYCVWIEYPDDKKNITYVFGITNKVVLLEQNHDPSIYDRCLAKIQSPKDRQIKNDKFLILMSEFDDPSGHHYHYMYIGDSLIEMITLESTIDEFDGETARINGKEYTLETIQEDSVVIHVKYDTSNHDIYREYPEVVDNENNPSIIKNVLDGLL